MRELVFTTRLKRNLAIDWHHEAGRTRAVLYGGHTNGTTHITRCHWPDMMFGVVRARPHLFSKWRPIALYAVPTRARPKSTTDIVIMRPGMSDVVCLGQIAAARVRDGRLDPVDAFWMTGFNSIVMSSYFPLRDEAHLCRTLKQIERSVLNRAEVDQLALTY